jgi:hypothetical protein
MPTYETDPIWLVIYWVVIGASLSLCVLTAIVLAWEFVRSWDSDPRRTEIRERLEQLDGQRKSATRVDQTRIANITTRRSGGAQR